MISWSSIATLEYRNVIPVSMAVWRAPQETALAFLFSKHDASTSFGRVWNTTRSHYSRGLSAKLLKQGLKHDTIPQPDQNLFRVGQTDCHQMNTHPRRPTYILCAIIQLQFLQSWRPKGRTRISDLAHHLYYLAHTGPREDNKREKRRQKNKGERKRKSKKYVSPSNALKFTL